MRSIFDIHDYDENFLEQFTTQTIPIYDLWSVRPLQNEQKELISGGSDEADKFRDFMEDHASQDFPHPLVIVIGNAEKSNTERMSNTSKKYFKLKFEKFKGNDLGTPLTIAGAPQPYPINNQQPMEFMGMGGRANPTNPMQGFSLGDIHGIIDRNVADATRSIKAEYQEQAAIREAESIKRMAELETRMEMYKLEMRAKEVESREQELRRELEELERKKSEGLGTVRDYTKTIAGGLFELGKSAFGLADTHSSDTHSSDFIKKESSVSSPIGNAIADDGFSEVSPEYEETKNEDSLNQILQGIANLDEEQKMALLDALMPEDTHGESDIKNDATQIAAETTQEETAEEDNIEN
jgi:hypothetical protein